LIISFLICPNGNGHLFRTIDLINFILKKKKNLKINIFCSKNHHMKIDNHNFLKVKTNIFPIIPNYDLRKNTYDQLLKLYNFKLSEEILKKTDVLISDNLINKYLPKNKTLLHSNFFWGDVYSSKKNLMLYKKLERKFLIQNTDMVISNRYFDIYKKKLNIKKTKIGFTGSKKLKKNNFLTKFKKKKILVYFSGNDLIPYNLIDKLKNEDFNIYTNNTELLKVNKNIIKFNRNETNMENLSYLITKPGLGSIKDCMKYGILPIFYFRKDNFEYIENFKKLKNIKILFKNEHSNEKKIFNNFKKINFLNYKNTLKNLDKFKFDGNEIFWNLIKKYEKKK
jgi:hypothetical protein